MKLASLALLLAAALVAAPLCAHGQMLSVVAAENFYGDVIEQIGGTGLRVTSILTNPQQDPHLFEASPSTARAIADARLVIYNGIDYDPWMEKLLASHRSPERAVIVVSALLDRKKGDNPHLWYDPAAMPAVANAVAAALVAKDPARRAEYEQRRDVFLGSLQPIRAKIEAIRQKYAKTVVTATEPVFGDMADALGLVMRNRPFQIAVMNDTEPSAGQIAGFEKDLRSQTAKLLFCNSQTSGDLTARLQRIARESKVPTVGITETEPPGVTYQAWILQALEATERALAGQSS
jgi:zinc/manganese transport system substrate-binding protein